MLKTVKFGGSSLADAKQFQKVADIIHADESRRYVVVSAPGKRSDDDVKITDLFYRCCNAARSGEDFTAHLEQIKARYDGIIHGLGLDLDLTQAFSIIRNSLRNDPDPHYAASRGEYLSAIVMAAYLKVPMVDAADCVRFTENGTFDSERTHALMSARLADLPRAVVPGFYGSQPDGSIRTFSRGGSDISGAIVARASGSDLYENWTDVSGMLTCDPRIIPNPKPIDTISYAELRELAYMGATVMHESAIFPVKKAGIPINIRNTNSPDDPGTMILPDTDGHVTRSITGISGKKGFTIIQLAREQMNEAVGFAMRTLQVLARYGLSAEHIPSGIDILSVVLSTQQLSAHREEVLEALQRVTEAETITVSDNVALLTVVGRGMVNTLGAAGRIFTTIGKAGVNVKMIDQGSGELNLIIGIDEADFERAISALYNEFF
ncbi:MAG: aspartate kinase [Clostridia bacterium]|nr:aspartate kinase [Clostridia bacterium]